MKPRISPLVPLAALLVLGACQATNSHWNADHASERASYHALAANGSTPDSVTQTTRQGSQEITLLVRRHFFNDNPHNPLQKQRANTFGRYVPIWDMPANAVLDVGDMLGVAGTRTGQGLWGAFVMPWQLVAGTSEVEGYRDPPAPSQFKVNKK